jgi:hypothetical protein
MARCPGANVINVYKATAALYFAMTVTYDCKFFIKSTNDNAM